MGRPKKYTPKAISYIRKNCGKASKKEMMKHLGVTYNALSRFLTELRKKYKDLPKYPCGGVLQSYEIGDVVIRTSNKRPDRHFVKTANGFREERKKDMREFRNKPRDVKAEPKPKGRTFKLPLSTSTESGQTQILLPGGGYVMCDSDKVEQTIRYLLKSG